MTSDLEPIARAIWERRRAYVMETMPDVGPLEEWGDGSIPRSNGVMEEARAAVEAMWRPLNLKEMDGTAALEELTIIDWLDAILNEKVES